MLLLVAVNAKYTHPAYAARSLLANLPPGVAADILEADLATTPFQLAEQIHARRPTLLAFSTYLWNAPLLRQAALIIRQINPCLPILFGGPEITDDTTAQFDDCADFLLIGEGETTLAQWALQPAAFPRIIRAHPVDTATLRIPTHLHTDADIAQKRTLYLETTRGCPYACAYCTSAKTTLRPIPLTTLLPAIDTYLARGIRSFKFLDRSFNALPDHAAAILTHLLAHPQAPHLTLHFEIHPGHFPDSLKTLFTQCPPGMLHLEVGIQTLNPTVSKTIGRGSDIETALTNLRFLTHETGADIHADLIFGLPGEDETSFANGFNRLLQECLLTGNRPTELQVNLLKLLPGTRLLREAPAHGLRFNPAPPYELLSSPHMDFATLTRLQRFARAWELTHNRGRFPRASRLLLQNKNPYAAYTALAQRIHAAEGRLHALGLPTLARHLEATLLAQGHPPAAITTALHADLNAKPL